MGRKADGAAPRDRVISVRLNPEEEEEFNLKRERRGLAQSAYFRALMKEDDGNVR